MLDERAPRGKMRDMCICFMGGTQPVPPDSSMTPTRRTEEISEACLGPFRIFLNLERRRASVVTLIFCVFYPITLTDGLTKNLNHTLTKT